MKWFQLDSDAPNDPKLKAVIRRGVAPKAGQSAAGAIWLLWCYVANQGKGEPGLGVKSDGGPLSLDEMACETLFDDVDELRAFIGLLVDRGHVHPEVWSQAGIVFLPAMWDRVSAYYRSKARKMTYQTAQEVVDAVLTSPGRALPSHDGPIRPKSALQDKTKQTRQDQQDHSGPNGPDLLSDSGPDQVDAVVALWNSERKPGPKVRTSIPEPRRRAIRRLLREYPDLHDWRRVIQHLNHQRWCNAPGTGDHPNFRYELNTLLKPGKFQAMLERADGERPPAADGTVGRDAGRGRTGSRPGIFAEALKGGTNEASR